jgi:dTDP-4-amino-4,6-dideoxygalactose transaminase
MRSGAPEGMGMTERRTIPFLRPAPPELSALVDELRAIESCGRYSNFGPVNARLESAVVEELLGGIGHCLAVANATLGLMLALRREARPAQGRRFALMASFGFAATPQAALWAGLTPLFVDIDRQTWNIDAHAEDALIERYGEEIACLVPTTTFGNAIDLDRYTMLARRHGFGVVIDAAAAVGTHDERGCTFGTGSEHPVIFSAHATKPFSGHEGGLIYSADQERIEEFRTMANFGFDQRRVSSQPGLNAKLSEVSALVMLSSVAQVEPVTSHRSELFWRYQQNLQSLAFQRSVGRRQSHQFVPVLLPEGWADRRAAILQLLAERGVEARTYHSPHLAEHPFFRETGVAGDLSVTQDVADRIVSLPLANDLCAEDVDYISEALGAVMEQAA